MNEKWFKYTWVCTGECDALIEYTLRAGYTPNVVDLTCLCTSPATLVSVEDATINIPTTEREPMLDNLEASIDFGAESSSVAYNPDLLVTYKIIHGYSDPEMATEKVRNIEWDLHNARQAQKHNAVLQDKINNVRDYIGERFADSDDQEALTEIAEFLDISLTKTITVSATLQVELQIDLPLDEVADFDASYFINDELSIDSSNGNVVIDSWNVDHVDVDWD